MELDSDGSRGLGEAAAKMGFGDDDRCCDSRWSDNEGSVAGRVSVKCTELVGGTCGGAWGDTRRGEGRSTELRRRVEPRKEWEEWEVWEDVSGEGRRASASEADDSKGRGEPEHGGVPAALDSDSKSDE